MVIIIEAFYLDFYGYRLLLFKFGTTNIFTKIQNAFEKLVGLDYFNNRNAKQNYI